MRKLAGVVQARGVKQCAGKPDITLLPGEALDTFPIMLRERQLRNLLMIR